MAANRPRFVEAWCQVKVGMTNTIGEKFVPGEWMWCQSRGVFVAPDGRTIKVDYSDRCFIPSTFQDRLTPPPGVEVHEHWNTCYWSSREFERKFRLLHDEFNLIDEQVRRSEFALPATLHQRYQEALRRLSPYRQHDWASKQVLPGKDLPS